MSDQPTTSNTAKIVVGVVLVLVVAYLAYSGLVVKKVAIPGVFEFDLGSKDSSGSKAQAAQQKSQSQASQPPSAQAVGQLDGRTVESTQINQPPAATRNSTCPAAERMFSIPLRGTWYGPFGPAGQAIVWYPNPGGLGVWRPKLRQIVNYPGPMLFQRNTWVNLAETPFNICTDSTGNVYGQYGSN